MQNLAIRWFSAQYNIRLLYVDFADRSLCNRKSRVIGANPERGQHEYSKQYSSSVGRCHRRLRLVLVFLEYLRHEDIGRYAVYS
jgi:hypothetical protein